MVLFSDGLVDPLQIRLKYFVQNFLLELQCDVSLFFLSFHNKLVAVIAFVTASSLWFTCVRDIV